MIGLRCGEHSEEVLPREGGGAAIGVRQFYKRSREVLPREDDNAAMGGRRGSP